MSGQQVTAFYSTRMKPIIPCILLGLLTTILYAQDRDRVGAPVYSIPAVQQISHSILADQWVRAFNDLSTQNHIVLRAVRDEVEISYKDVTEMASLGSLLRVTRSVPGNRTIRFYLRADDIIELTESFD